MNRMLYMMLLKEDIAAYLASLDNVYGETGEWVAGDNGLAYAVLEDFMKWLEKRQ